MSATRLFSAHPPAGDQCFGHQSFAATIGNTQIGLHPIGETAKQRTVG